jgi:uncharacterized protein
MEQIIRILEFTGRSFLHIWPYLLVTIPLAVIINISGASKYITRAFGKNPVLAVLLATCVGAFSPFCSCGVIPVISSLLIGGVPLAPVMSFWIASPSMDPEIFFLSSSVIGWRLAVWRLASTFVISLLSGYITLFVTRKGFIGSDVLKERDEKEDKILFRIPANPFRYLLNSRRVNAGLVPEGKPSIGVTCCVAEADISSDETCCTVRAEANGECVACPEKEVPRSLWIRILKEIMKAVLIVTKFMGFAFLVTALITFYLPGNLITGIISVRPVVQVVLATLIGIPMYTSNITALPLAGGLIDLGMNRGAALAFLIAGATTTLPAMIAVFGITKRRVFLLYLSFSLFGALLAGFCFNIFN